MGLTRVLLLLAPLTFATITPNDQAPVNNGPDSLSQLFRHMMSDPSRRTPVLESKQDYLQTLAVGIVGQLQERYPELGPVHLDEILEMKLDETMATMESIEKFGSPYAITFHLKNDVPCRTVVNVHHTIDETTFEMDRQTTIGSTTCRGSKPEGNYEHQSSPM